MDERQQGRQKRVIGWKTNSGNASQQLLVMLNFEGHDVPVDVHFDPGRWIKLGDIDHIDDLPPVGNKDPLDADSIIISDNMPAQHFVLPPYSGFIYKYQQA